VKYEPHIRFDYAHSECVCRNHDICLAVHKIALGRIPLF
jgi:hypothetical protein